MAGKIKILEGKSVSFDANDNLQVQFAARGVGESADVQFKFTQKDGSELFGNSPRLLAAWDQVAKIAVVARDGERYELALTPSRTETKLPPPN